jgi:hypothetical protein
LPLHWPQVGIGILASCPGVKSLAPESKLDSAVFFSCPGAKSLAHLVQVIIIAIADYILSTVAVIVTRIVKVKIKPIANNLFILEILYKTIK